MLCADILPVVCTANTLRIYRKLYLLTEINLCYVPYTFLLINLKKRTPKSNPTQIADINRVILINYKINKNSLKRQIIS